MPDDHPEILIAEAKSLSELNIHMGYIRQKIAENSINNGKNFQDLKEQIQLQSHSFVLQDEFKPLAKTVEEIRTTQKELVAFKDTLTGKMLGVGAMSGIIVGIIMIVISHYIK